jgi:transketolase
MPERHGQLKEYSIGPSKGSTANWAQLMGRDTKLLFDRLGNKTTLTYEGAGSFQADSPGGKNLHFGISGTRDGGDCERAFAMHDAMGDGEDDPSHQPVEHLLSLRAIPGLITLRPGDANEVVEAYRYIMQLRQSVCAL